jgi:hypothetical protein
VAENEADPPVFASRTDAAGRPVVGTSFEGSNNGFVVWGLTSDVKGIELVGLHFRDFQRAVAFAPSHVPSEDCRPTAGTLSQARVARSHFVNSFPRCRVRRSWRERL